MNLLEYQRRTIETAIYPGAGTGNAQEMAYLGLGLASESGELAGLIKKEIRDGKFDLERFVKECGDVLWYLCRLADTVGLDLELIAEANYNKLQRRKATGTIGGSGDFREKEVSTPVQLELGFGEECGTSCNCTATKGTN